MKNNMLTWGAALASTLFALAPAHAAPEETGHAAINACSTVNPAQPVMVLSAVNDGSGIGFSLVWLNDKDGGLWMCDADADGNVYSYSLVTKDLLRRRRRADRPSADGQRRLCGPAPEDRREGLRCLSRRGRQGAAQRPGRA